MRKINNKPNTSWKPLFGSNLVRPRQPSSVRGGGVNVNTVLLHFSIIIYAIPIERVTSLMPFSFKVEESAQQGCKFAWLSIVSFSDRGTSISHYSAFEQTNYCLHVLSDGKPYHWLLGISLGSLSAVAVRNLWPMPWHLSAMEFQVAYDKAKGRYQEYRLQTQSQWDNANWAIIDTGEALSEDQIRKLPPLISPSTTPSDNYFLRRDESLGLYSVRYHGLALTSGKLRHAQSDLLESSGILSRDELNHPVLVAVQHKVFCQNFPSRIIGDSQIGSIEGAFEDARLVYAI